MEKRYRKDRERTGIFSGLSEFEEIGELKGIGENC